MMNQALYFISPNQISVIDEPVPTPSQDEVLVKNSWSAISAGTEMLFFQGLAPNDIECDESIPSLKHQFSYPFKYGYCAVGKIIEVGSDPLKHLIDKWVFVFNPHESYFVLNMTRLSNYLIIYLLNRLYSYQVWKLPSISF